MSFDAQEFVTRMLAGGGSSAGRMNTRSIPTPSAPGEQVIYGPERFEPSGGAPSKRANKNRSGRSGRKAYNGSRWVTSVGGTKDVTAAIYAPADKELCVTVDPRRGYRGGKPFRSPR